MRMKGLHNRLVAQFIERHPDFRTTRFLARLDKIFCQCSHGEVDENGEPVEECIWCGERERFPIVPDAFRIDEQRMEVIMVEVECTNPLRPEKLAKILDLWWTLDGEGWALGLILVDPGGAAHEADLYRFVQEHLSKAVDDESALYLVGS